MSPHHLVQVAVSEHLAHSAGEGLGLHLGDGRDVAHVHRFGAARQGPGIRLSRHVMRWHRVKQVILATSRDVNYSIHECLTG